jgi:hypothetical protein
MYASNKCLTGTSIKMESNEKFLKKKKNKNKKRFNSKQNTINVQIMCFHIFTNLYVKIQICRRRIMNVCTNCNIVK